MDASMDLARFFKALGDDTRLRLVALLVRQHPGQAMCVSRLARELGTTTPNVSQHLRVLKDLGLLQGQRRRHRIHYFLNIDRLAHYQALAGELLGQSFLVTETTN